MTNFANWMLQGYTGGEPADGQTVQWNQASRVWNPVDFPFAGASASGWVAVATALTYSSADAPTFVAGTASDLSGSISVGMRLRLTQTTVKYFIVTAISSTTITLYGGTDYTLVNAAISAVAFSSAKAPLAFPSDPDKWTIAIAVKIDDVTVASTTTNFTVSTVPVTLTLPIGAWAISYQQRVGATGNIAAGGVRSVELEVGLSSVDNDFDQDDLMVETYWAAAALSGVTSMTINPPVSITGQRTVAAKTTYYANGRITVAATPDSVQIYDANWNTIGLNISARSLYL